MKTCGADFGVKLNKGIVEEIGKSYIEQPEIKWNGKGIKWFDDSQLMKKKARNYIVMDLEMSAVAKTAENKDLSHRMEIIQIGAVLLDSKYQEVGHFMTLVKPQFNTRIERNYEKLTGITTEMVAEAPVFEEAIKMFFQWCTSVKSNTQICQWSTSDLHQIKSEIAMKGYYLTKKERELLTNWCDFQQEYGEKLGVEGCLSLKKALMYAGVDATGHFHDALDDARNTATLLSTVRDEEKCKKALQHVIDAIHPQPFGTSLGTILSGFQLAM
ncbi:MAG: 3'-5' exonuclease [Eubacteriales bacterium]|nr:3'-5' exonuclease [Eubacteriales bacterium]